MADWNSWMITADERVRHDKQFTLLNPVNGFLGKDQLKAFFLKSDLPPFVLGKIWALSDITADGKMDRKEFSIAMFLIKKRLEGMHIPDTLPVGLGVDPQPTALVSAPLSAISNLRMQTTTCTLLAIPTYSPSLNGVTATSVTPITNNQPPGMTYGRQPQQKQEPTWVLSCNLQSRYEDVFKNHDRYNRGHITGLEAKSILKTSGLSQSTLAHIWSLSDIDKDGNLNCAEFCIASYLIGVAVAGVQLPNTLPASLHPSQHSDGTDATCVPNADNGDDSDRSLVTTFEDKRRANFLQGQAELERRRQQLSDRMRLEKEARIEKERKDLELEEKARLEKQHKEAEESQRQTEWLRELQVQRESRRRQTEEARQNARRTTELQLRLDSEHQRMDRLLAERNQCETRRQQALAHKASLMETVSDQQLRNNDLLTRINRSQSSINQTKSEINEKRIKRDNYERELRDLTEQVEAAKAELSHWQREGQQLTLKVGMGLDTNPAGEQCKTLQANCELRSKSIHQLREHLANLDLGLTQQGEELASWRNKEHDVTRRSIKFQSELAELRRSVVDMRNKTGKSSAFSSVFASEGVPPNRLGNFAQPPPTGTTPYEVMFDFLARHPDELSLKTSSVVYVYTDPPVALVSGWLYGQLAATVGGTGKPGGEKGLFPETYVRKQMLGTIDAFDPFGVHKPSVSSRSEPVSSSGAPTLPEAEAESCTSITPFRCRALYAYDSSVTGDLNLVVGDVIRVHTIRDAWWEGTCERTNLSGLFPANYTQRIDCKGTESLLRQLSDTQSSPFTTSAPTAFSSLPSDLTAFIRQRDSQPSTSGVDNWAPLTKQHEVSIASSRSSPPTFAASNANTMPSTTTASASWPAAATVPNSESSSTRPDLARAIAPFAGTSPGQLSLQPGQMVLVRKRLSKGWWEGELQQRGRVRQFGWFPADYVRLISPSSSHSVGAKLLPPSDTNTLQRPTSARAANVKTAVVATTRRSGSCLSDQMLNELASEENGGTGDISTIKSTRAGTEDKKYSISSPTTTSPPGTAPRVDLMQALFAYKAAHADELSFEEGDIITLLSRDEPEWWRGRLQAGGVEGLFPVNYVKPYHSHGMDQEKSPTRLNSPTYATDSTSTMAASLSANQESCDMIKTWAPTSKRDRVIQELIVTESSYISHLEHIKQMIYCPLSTSGILNATQLEDIFLNWDELLQFARQFLFILESRLSFYLSLPTSVVLSSDSNFCVGGIFLQELPKMVVLQRYCVQQPYAYLALSQCIASDLRLDRYLGECERQAALKSTGVPFLTSQLVIPMQRMTKYRLLLTRILEHTPLVHPDFADTQDALLHITQMLDDTNDAINAAEPDRLLQWLRDHLLSNDSTAIQCLLSPSSELEVLQHGKFSKVTSNKEIIGFLFRQYLLLTVPLKSNGNKPFPYPLTSMIDERQHRWTLKIYKQPIRLDQVMVTISCHLNGQGQHAPPIHVLSTAIGQFASVTKKRARACDISETQDQPTFHMESLPDPATSTTVFTFYHRSANNSSSSSRDRGMKHGSPQPFFLSLQLSPECNRDSWITQLYSLVDQ